MKWATIRALLVIVTVLLLSAPAFADERVRLTVCDKPGIFVEFTKEWYEANCKIVWATVGGYAPGAREEPRRKAIIYDVPAKYRRTWCTDLKHQGSERYYPCRQANAEGSPAIERNRIWVDEENACPITGIFRTAKGHRLRVQCPPSQTYAGGRPPKSVQYVELWIDARGNLHMQWTD
jgi:hypothetical protein